MATTEVAISFRSLARELSIPESRIQAVVELLDAGNTVPFITRYRKDQTGGLDEEQIRTIFARVKKLRQLAERKQTILRAIESQNKLTPELARKILAANSLRRLEDLYLPFRPKKQTLATIARERGLGHLAEEILNADPICEDLDKRAADYIDPDKKVLSIADALLGAGHILAEIFSEKTELRSRLRDILMKTGVIRTSRIVPETAQSASSGSSPTPSAGAAPLVTEESPQKAEQAPATAGPGKDAGSALSGEAESTVVPKAGEAPSGSSGPSQNTLPAFSPEETSAGIEEMSGPSGMTGLPGQPVAAEAEGAEPLQAAAGPGAVPTEEVASEAAESPTVAPLEEFPRIDAEVHARAETSSEAASQQERPGESDQQRLGEGEVSQGATDSASSPVVSDRSSEEPPGQRQPETSAASTAPQPTGVQPPDGAITDPKKAAKEAEKRRKEEKLVKEFADYFNFSEPVRKIPPHRVLAINRGESLKILRVRIEADMEAMEKAVEELCVLPGHPHADFLKGCAKDALVRLILPSLEREIRRELTERAENHAVKVFAQNLRRLLVQRPVRDRRVLAIDPGYRQGCKLAALDECGNVLDHGLIYLVDKKGYSRETAKKTVIEMVEKHQLTAIAIGNGSGCRLAEVFIAELLENELKGRGIGYTIVNEAGASVYSTSQIGREELPHLDAVYRGAVSIGRRLLDPLSELVKIEPANLGVGLYQHDLKEKHLRESLDEVVESCVNYVGVDVNTASPALLRYVSGLNKLTARRIVEYREQHGPFKTREELRKVPGIGEATFVQAAGFLKIVGGDNPLDATWIHPESYELATRVLEKLGFTPQDLTKPERKAELAGKIAQVNAEELAAELNCGVLLLKDILAQFVRPGRDPREDLPPPVFKQGIVKLEDLSPGLELMGTVVNVVDFGAFVDVGLPNTGLIHRSRMKPFARSADPYSTVAVGDVVRVWVVDVDRDRRRLSLSLVPPEQIGEKKTGDGKLGQGKGKAEGREKTAKSTLASSSKESPEKGREPPASRQRQDRQERPTRPEVATGPHAPAPLALSRPVELPRRLGKSEPPPSEPLSEEVLTGKQPMRSFADLFQYFAAKGVVRPPAPSRSPREKAGGKKKSGTPGGNVKGRPETDGSASSSEAKHARPETGEKQPVSAEDALQQRDVSSPPGNSPADAQREGGVSTPETQPSRVPASGEQRSPAAETDN